MIEGPPSPFAWISSCSFLQSRDLIKDSDEKKLENLLHIVLCCILYPFFLYSLAPLRHHDSVAMNHNCNLILMSEQVGNYMFPLLSQLFFGSTLDST